MYDVMDGVKVIEVAEHTFVPAAGMVLADWGADVIKIERVGAGGDPGRSLAIPNSSGNGFNMYFEAGNRGKRSVALDLTQPEGREILYKLVETADVFITNMRAKARRKMGIEPEELMKRNPRLIYARGSGYGIRGDMADDGGFDYPSSWCRSGAAWMLTQPGSEPISQPGSVGDLGGGVTTAGAIAAALFRRERTGKGAIVDNALYLFGIYLMSQSVIGVGLGLDRGPSQPRSESFNPIMNTYRTSDDRWILLSMMYDAWWPDLCRHLDRPDLIDDPRYHDGPSRFANNRALIAELEAIFAAHDFAWWRERLKTAQGVWSPLLNPSEVAHDPQAQANEFVTEVHAPDGRSYLAGVSPAQFDQQTIGELKAAPAYAAHTADVLGELGLAPGDVEQLRTAGVVL
jgi:formyl-CoA transferase